MRRFSGGYGVRTLVLQAPPLILTRLAAAILAAVALLATARAGAPQSPTLDAALEDPAPVDVAPVDVAPVDAAPPRVAEFPISAACKDGLLVLRFGGPGERISAVARWPVDEVPRGSHAYRAARLELLDGTAADDRALESAEPIPVHGRPEWDEVVTQVMIDLAPAGSNG